jgi:hypothetical protein
MTQHDFTLSSAHAFVSLAAILPAAMHTGISARTLKVIKIICFRHSSACDESDRLRSHCLPHMHQRTNYCNLLLSLALGGVTCSPRKDTQNVTVNQVSSSDNLVARSTRRKISWLSPCTTLPLGRYAHTGHSILFMEYRTRVRVSATKARMHPQHDQVTYSASLQE